MSRKNIVAGNWKMNLDLKSGHKLTQEICKADRDSNVQVILAVPFIHLSEVGAVSRYSSTISLAAQNVHFESNGAFTGEISSAMLKSTGAEYVLIGHSERRTLFNESNDVIKKKVDAALAKGLKVIFCCGESLEVRKKKRQNTFVKGQIVKGLFHLTPKQFKNVIIAYEPIWAIGTGETASPEQAQEMHAYIRKQIEAKYEGQGSKTSILYGGSVKPDNAKELFAQQDIDGGLVGGASLKAKTFVPIINAFK